LFEARKWYWEKRIERTLEALKRNGFDAVHVPDGKAAVSRVLELIPEDALVGIGGSVTLREIGLLEALERRGNTLANHWQARQRGATAEETQRIRRQQINSDAFVTSTNAVTEKGELINVDGAGQRVAAMIFGPKKVIVIAGINKIVGDIDEGIDRVRELAAPMNAKRLNLKTPCAVTGVCSDCDSKDRICNVTSIIQKMPWGADITVVLVGQSLGY